MTRTLPLALCLVVCATADLHAQRELQSIELHVDPRKGRDSAKGTRSRPLRSISAAIAKLPDPLLADATIHLAAGQYDDTGGTGMPEHSLELWRRMAPRVRVRLVGPATDGAEKQAVLAWPGENHMVDVHEGRWHLEQVQIGTFSTKQRRGVTVFGPAQVTLQDVTCRLRSNSDSGIWATGGGRAHLRGAIRLNDHLHDEAGDETFCNILATDGGVVEFAQHGGASLELGNGNLSVRYYGSIRLGCDRARITCWTKSNNLTVNNGGRIDLRNTKTVLCAKLRNNTPIGLEHDGHVLAEDTHITIVGPNDSAVALQKASTFYCNDVELQGEFEYAIWASSGSVFVGRFLGDVPKLKAKTGASICLERLAGKLTGEVIAESGGTVALPDRVVR